MRVRSGDCAIDAALLGLGCAVVVVVVALSPAVDARVGRLVGDDLLDVSDGGLGNSVGWLRVATISTTFATKLQGFAGDVDVVRFLAQVFY